MKKLTTILLVFNSFVASAQIQITDSLFESFIKKEIANINFKLYYAAIEGKVTAYTNDSCKTIYSINELKEQGSYTFVAQVTDRYGDAKDTMYVVPFDPAKNFVGLRLTYEQDLDLNTQSIRHRVKGIGPLYMNMMGKVHVGTSHMFLIKTTDVNNILNQNELNILQAFTAQNSQFGDFRTLSERYYKDGDSSDLGHENAFRALTLKQQGIVDWIDYSIKTPLLSAYNTSLFSVVLSHIANKQDTFLKPVNTLFKDIALSEPYINPKSELKSEIYEEKNDEYGDTRYVGYVIPYGFGAKYDYTISKDGDDFILDFTIPFVPMTQPDAHIFLSFNAVKSLFPEQDGIVWEVFLKDLFRE